jgi:phytoene/squalene synthetase
MQLTNIARDICRDAVQRNKIYLPQEAFLKPLEPNEINQVDQLF